MRKLQQKISLDKNILRRYQSGDRGGSAATSPRDVGTPGSGIGQDHEQLVDSKGFCLPEIYQNYFVTGMPTSMSQSGYEAAVRPSSRTTSAPTSPLRERASKRDGFLGKVSVLSQVISILRTFHQSSSFSKQVVTQAKDTAAAYKLTGINKNRCFSLLVIDDHNTDW